MRIFLSAILLLLSTAAQAATAPALCAAGTGIAYPAPGAPPLAGTWSAADKAAGRVVADCTRWLSRDFKLNAAEAGSFSYKGDAAGLLARFGAVSGLQGLPYWSATDRRWERLITRAAALDGPAAGPRADFASADLKAGKDLYFSQTDNRSSSAVVYHMRIEADGPERVVVRVENVSSVRFLIMTVYNPGDLQSVYVLDRQSPGTWGYFNLTGIDSHVSFLGGSPAKSALNRADALYRHFTGLPAEPDPPLAR